MGQRENEMLVHISGKTVDDMRLVVKKAKKDRVDHVLGKILGEARLERTRCEIDRNTDKDILEALKELGYRVYEEKYEKEIKKSFIQKIGLKKPTKQTVIKWYVDWSE
ncbi:MAG: hypothetical protein ACRDD7_06855 [Peptostreptococcaceae bacterium]